MNSKLNLPQALAQQYPIDTFYDLRVIFDPYRNRFWAAGLARNSHARDGKTCVDLSYHRSKVVVVVSETEDPTGGWLLYWWDAIADDGRS